MSDKLGELGANVQDRFDLWQQRLPVLAFPISVWLRYREDRCYEYAALLSYYGFFSLFPLLTVGVTIVGFVLSSRPNLRAELLDTIFGRFPVVGEELARQIDGLEGNGLVLIIAVGFTLWAGMGVVRVAQDAFNVMWGVSIMRRPSFFPKLFRALAALLVVGGAFVLATVAAGFATFAFDLPGAERIALVVLTIVINALMLLVAFKVLTAAPVGWRALVAGALAGGVAAPVHRRHIHRGCDPRGTRRLRVVCSRDRPSRLARTRGSGRAPRCRGQRRRRQTPVAAQLHRAEPHQCRRTQLRRSRDP